MQNQENLTIDKINILFKKYLILVLSINFFICGIIALDYIGLGIPILRQFIGFIYLTIIPGFVILQLLNIKQLEFTEGFLLSLGLSLSFLMIVGFIFSQFLVFIGYENPLGTIPLLIFLVFSTTILAILAYLKKRITYLPINLKVNFNKLDVSEKVIIIMPLFFPILSIIGTTWLNINGNNIILMIFLILVSVYIVLITINKYRVNYAFSIFLISISILLMGALRSNHIIGIDIHNEYYMLQQTLNTLSWNYIGVYTLDSCLSISLLPAIYVAILKVNPEFLFKTFYSLIFSFVPLIVYYITKKYINDSYAFFAALFFIFQLVFFNTMSNPRTSIAILFFAIAFFIFFNDKIETLKKRFLFIIFIISCVLSHYSTTYEFFWIIMVLTLSLNIISKIYYRFKNIEIISENKMINWEVLFLFFALIVLWYSQLTGKAFDSGFNFIIDTVLSLNNFFYLDSRSGIPALVGQGIDEKGIPQQLQFIFTWFTLGFIGLGVTSLLVKYKNMSFDKLRFKKTKFLKNKFEVTYLLLVISCSVLLFAFFALPFISTGYSIDRTFMLSNVVLSGFFVIGTIIFSLIINKIQFIRNIKIKPEIIMLIILIPYFLCVSGFMYNIFGNDKSILLNSHGIDYNTHYVHDEDSYAAKWLYKYKNSDNNGKIRISTGDYIGRLILISQGNFSPFSVSETHFEKFKQENGDIKGYIFLRYHNTVNGELIRLSDTDMKNYTNQLTPKNKIYANGGSEILYS